MKYTMRNSGDVRVARVCDPKFKSNAVTVRLSTYYSEEKAAAYALIPAILTSTNRKFPDTRELARRLTGLYGASLSYDARVIGGMYDIVLSMSYLDDKYALDGDKIAVPASEILLDCIFDPVVENGGFKKSEFEVRRKNLLDSIDAEINDKISYAIVHAMEIAYRGEPAGNRYFASRKAVEELTPEGVYEVYKELLRTAKVTVSFCGGGNFDEIEQMFVSAFSIDGADRCDPPYIDYSPLKPETEYAEMLLDVQQANLIMIFKNPMFNYAAAAVMSMLYGESPTSKLFMNVREKMSLCYHCSSGVVEAKGAIIVVSGVAPENIDTARQEILHQLKKIADGDFTDEELSDCSKYFSTELRSTYDSVRALERWFYMTSLNGNNGMTPDQMVERLSGITREQVMKAAADFKLDTVFVLKNKTGEASE